MMVELVKWGLSLGLILLTVGFASFVLISPPLDNWERKLKFFSFFTILLGFILILLSTLPLVF